MASCIAVVASVAGCGSKATTNLVCVPPCLMGTHCAPEGCIPDDNSGAEMMVTPDLGGACSPGCSGATPYCNASMQCVACLMDSQCPAGYVCEQAGSITLCVPGCSDDARCGTGEGGVDLRCCSGRCTDTTRDTDNCGGCGVACGMKHASARCEGGACSSGACSTGWGDCNSDPSDGCEVNLKVDARNCGACGTPCALANAVAGCSDACYVAACSFGFDDCNADPHDGCEVSTSSDPRNCGLCGRTCNSAPHAQIGCFVGECRVNACNFGFGNCDRVYQNGCETNLLTDIANCGACANACLQGQVCINGECTCPACSFPNANAVCLVNQCVIGSCLQGWGNCDANTKNGCEQDIGTDRFNCGGCGIACAQNLVCVLGSCTCPQCNIPHAKTRCVNNQCILDSCLPGFADCDLNPANGCETDINSDPANCSACGNVCAQGMACALGMCTTCGNALIDNGGILCVPRGMQYALAGDKCYSSQVIINGVLTVTPSDGKNGGALVLRSPSILVGASGVINGDSAGAPGGLQGQANGGHSGVGSGGGCGGGPGNSVGQGGSGGGYGGVGGTAKPYQNIGQCDRCDNPTVAHCWGLGGVANGTLNAADVDLGSGGGAAGNSAGCGNAGGRGGAGGASILLLAKSVQIDGLLTANGEQPPPDPGDCKVSYRPGGGGGSGGAVVVRAETLSGMGVLSASGGQGGNTIGMTNDWGWSGGGGGGGRVKTFSPADSFKGSLTVTGGKGGTTCGGGQCTVGFTGGDGTTSRSQAIPNAWSVINCGGL